jgi:hypothetical protein
LNDSLAASLLERHGEGAVAIVTAQLATLHRILGKSDYAILLASGWSY